jgi:hypothetical protein
MVLACALALAGCPGDPGHRIDAGPAPVAEIGTGTLAFEPLDDDQPVELVKGPQGGHHFIVHARMRGLTPGDPRQSGLPENPTTYFRALDENGVRVDIPEIRQIGYTPETGNDAGPEAGPDAGPEAGSDRWYTLPSGRLLIIDNAAADRLYGRPVTLEVLIRDPSGRQAGDTARIIAVAGPPRGRGAPEDAGGRDSRSDQP